MQATPDQNYWKEIFSVQLWVAIVLSLDIEPRNLEDIPSIIPSVNCNALATMELKILYKERFTIALNHLDNGKLKAVKNESDHLQEITLAEFVSWSQSLDTKWNIPDWLQSHFSQGVPINKPPNVIEENTWAKLLGAVLEEARIDYSEPYTLGKIFVAKTVERGTPISLSTTVEKLKRIPPPKKIERTPS